MSRLDVELVRRRLLPSRAAARRAILDGRVTVGGVATGIRPATNVGDDDRLEVEEAATRYVGRGGHKLAAALSAFPIDVAGLRRLDVGSSTGGFSDCLLQHGAAEVVAVDVGTGQLHPSLAADPRVTSREQTDIRSVTADDLGGPFSFVAVDVSFISLALLAPVVAGLVAPAGDVVALIKPQFEVGPDALRKDGVVADETDRSASVATVVEALKDAGLDLHGLVPSPITGGAGNHEDLAWLRPTDQDGTHAD
jgi:23S rRNA (cytidine1920-2'-O)/16S rRNA (cytidine1409-2'-O)-methyltransferase